jgi:uncharacterized membrane protein HdeD (DUF308 family)
MTAKIFDILSRIVFTAAAVILMLLALAMIVHGAVQAFSSVFEAQAFSTSILQSIGFVIVALAVFEVAKYIIEEDVVRGREMRVASEARRSLTKFVSTIAIAVLLEGLVTVFRVTGEGVADLIFPAILLLTGMLLILGLGVFQRLSASVERDVEHKDKVEEQKHDAESSPG